MEIAVLDQIRGNLKRKRDALREWLRATPAETRQIRLGGAAEQQLDQHLATLETAAEQAESGVLGQCTVCHEDVETPLLEMDYTASVCLSHLSAEQQRTLESELELAQAVQLSLLPHAPPDTPSLQIAAFSRPAQIIGGDYFGFFRFQDGAEGLAIADVAGHGVSASLHMAGIHALLQALVATTDSPAAVLDQVQRLFIHNASFSTFASVFLAAYDPRRGQLSYCNAGHNPPLLVHTTGAAAERITWLEPTGPAVGLIEEASFRVEQCDVRPGDVLLLYTDGVTEALGAQGDEYGPERLAAAVGAVAGETAGRILQAARQDLDRYVDGRALRDDTTLVVCKVLDPVAQ